MKVIQEGSCEIYIPKEKKISARLEIFYNPVMKLNRDISIMLLNAVPSKNMQIGLPLAATGIRGLRFLKELNKNKIKNISFNDHNPNFKGFIKKNLELNKIKSKKIIISNEDASKFLLNSTGFDYVDLDPFGSPNPFLDAAVKRLSRDSILAITSTDTAALASFQKVCLRKYWAQPLLTAEKHEAAIRILIRKVQLVAAQYDKALTPIFSYFKDHYYRIFFQSKKSKTDVDKKIKQHGYYKDAGPMWLGQLWDRKLAQKMYRISPDNFLKTITEESKMNVVGFFDMHEICKKNKLVSPKKDLLLQKLAKRHRTTPTHFTALGIRTTASEKELVRIIRRLV